jgi:hypothetical protein
LEDYFEAFSDGLENFRLKDQKRDTFDDAVVQNLEAELPYRNEFIEIITVASRYWQSPFLDNLHRFFERVAVYQFRPVQVTSWSDWDFDNFHFFNYELILYAVAALIRSNRLAEVADWLGRHYYIGEVASDAREPMIDFTVFNEHIGSLEYRNQRLKLGRLSLHADLLEQRSHSSGIKFNNIMQADFLLYLRDQLTESTDWRRRWWPVTLIYTGRMRGPFEVFARARSRRYFDQLKAILGIADKSIFDDLMTQYDERKREAPHWRHISVNPPALANWTNLCTVP